MRASLHPWTLFDPDFSFEKLKSWLATLPDQSMGNPDAIADACGEPYEAFAFGALARPGDEVVVEALVANHMGCYLADYFKGRPGRIYWRIPLEWSIEWNAVVLAYDSNGPDLCYTTNQKCVKDHNWKAVKAYCRVVKAKEKQHV